MKKDSTQSFLLKGNCKRLIRFLLVGIFLVSQLTAYGQQKTVTGTVTGEDGNPLVGVTIVVKGTVRGALTDVDGKYSIPDLAADDVLSFSFVGMKVQEFTVGNQTSIDVRMESDAFGLSEVVVIGYGTSRKQDLTGSIVKVEAEDFLK